MNQPKQNRSLKIAEQMRSQNLQMLRIIAAIGVLCTHAQALSKGTVDGEWLVKLSGGQFTCGFFSVAVFFVISGFFGARTALRQDKNSSLFLINRFCRLWPALTAVAVISILAGLYFTTFDLVGYVTNLGTWKYLINCLFIPIHELPGVFTGHPYGPTVNGSLWTLSVEVVCYVGCAICLWLRLLEKRYFALTVPAAAVMFMFFLWAGRFNPLIWSAAFPCILCYYLGMAFWVYRENILLDIRIGFLLLVPAVLLIHFNKGHLGVYAALPYWIFLLGYGFPQVPVRIGKTGDRSYELYLWGYPTQQAVVHVFGGHEMDPLMNFLIAVPVAFLLAWMTGFLLKALHRIKGTGFIGDN